MNNKVWKLDCPICGKERIYKSMICYLDSLRLKRSCVECGIKKKINHPCYKSKSRSKKLSDINKDRKITWKQFNGINRDCDYCKKQYYVIPCRIGISKFCSNKCSSEFRKVNNPKSFVKPAINFKGCDFFNYLNINSIFNGIHGGDGEEYYIKDINRWLDYYDQVLNCVIEWDEDHHNWGKFKERDKEREIQIISKLNCSFFRIKQKDLKLIIINKTGKDYKNIKKILIETLNNWKLIK